MAMLPVLGDKRSGWRALGAGIAQGYATLGQIGFSERSGYTAIGTVCNLAARLCAEAKDGQILVSSHIAEAVEVVVRLEDLGNLELSEGRGCRVRPPQAILGPSARWMSRGHGCQSGCTNRQAVSRAGRLVRSLPQYVPIFLAHKNTSCSPSVTEGLWFRPN